MALPIIQDPNQNLMRVQQNWKSKIDPIISNPFVSGKALNGVNLNAGSTTIPHGLSGAQQGWVLTDVSGDSTIYRSAPFNSTNLILTSTAAVTVNLWVF